MKLKTKLLISFTTLIVMPIVLIVISFAGVGSYQLRAVKQEFRIENADINTISDYSSALGSMSRAVYIELKEKADADVQGLLTEEYLERINTELMEHESFLLVRKGGKFPYCGTDKDISYLKGKLPAYGESSFDPDLGLMFGRAPQMFVRGLDLPQVKAAGDSDKEKEEAKTTIFVVSKLGGMMPQLKSLILDMILSIVTILVFTSAVLTMWIYRSLVTPIQDLKIATQNIRDGNLDFEMTVEGQDEISELCRDFEEMRKRLKESAEETCRFENEQRELISNISHDLKTPITAIKGYMEGIMDGVADTPEKQQKYIRTVYNKANDMDRLINELTFYSKIDTNRIPYVFDKINVAGYFEDCVEEIGLELEERGFKLSYVNTVEPDVMVIADAEQIKRVINNIIGNSMKYCDKKQGEIEIRVQEAGDFIQVDIEDNGSGIAAKDLPYIFDRFYRTDASRNSSRGGSGIGLSIVKKIIYDHGGQIWATSKLGLGTTMHFVLRKYYNNRV